MNTLTSRVLVPAAVALVAMLSACAPDSDNEPELNVSGDVEPLEFGLGGQGRLFNRGRMLWYGPALGNPANNDIWRPALKTSGAAEGTYRFLNIGRNLCLGDGDDDNDITGVHDCNGDFRNQWKVTIRDTDDEGTDYITLANHVTGECLEWMPNDGVDTLPCDEGIYQTWEYRIQ